MSKTEFTEKIDGITGELDALMGALRKNVAALQAILTAPDPAPEVPGDHATA